MVRRKHGSVPALRHHKPSGKAVVTLSGQDFYCGTWGTRTALAEYDKQVAEWLAHGRPLFQGDDRQEMGLTVIELCAAYKRHVKNYYRKDGKPTTEVAVILSALRVVKSLYGRDDADAFDSLKLQAVQQAMVRLGWARQSINRQSSRIIRMFARGKQKQIIDDLPPHAAEVYLSRDHDMTDGELAERIHRHAAAQQKRGEAAGDPGRLLLQRSA